MLPIWLSGKHLAPLPFGTPHLWSGKHNAFVLGNLPQYLKRLPSPHGASWPRKTKMSVKSARGAKRKCQNEECLAPFYDLGRSDFECPVCGTAFDHEAAERAAEPQTSKYPSRKQPRVLPIVASAEPGEVGDDAEEDDIVAEVTADDDDSETSTEAPDGLLESEDDDDNLANAIEIPATNENDDT